LKLRAALRNGSPFRATLGGCAAKVDERKILTLLREAPRRRGTAVAAKTPQPGEFVELPTE
jgi:hypothetical protein